VPFTVSTHFLALLATAGDERNKVKKRNISRVLHISSLTKMQPRELRECSDTAIKTSSA
jgi:hypothetical protein